jgi:osmotically-inducible protein OsmY
MGQLVKKTDAQFQQDVLQELRWDTRVKETDIGVEVDRGIVTLTGTVDSWAARIAAQEAAHRVAGVLDVANDIHVKLPASTERTDADIARAARAALEWDVLVPDAKIRTTVTNGVVTLEGEVDYWTQHDDAGRAMRNLAGVREVKNLISVAPHARTVSPETLREAIDGALQRHIAHAAKHVNIVISGSKILLTGEVPSWAEHDAVVGAVRATHGVATVDDQLRIGS